MVALVKGINEVVDQFSDENVVGNLAQAIDDLRNHFDNPKLNEGLAHMAESIKGISELLGRINPKIDPLFADVHAAAGELNDTLAEARESLDALESAAEEARAMIAPESTLRYRLEEALTQLGAAAASIERLADQLERNPQAVLTGKDPGENRKANP
jgi:paraquat-inducible protein B